MNYSNSTAAINIKDPQRIAVCSIGMAPNVGNMLATFNWGINILYVQSENRHQHVFVLEVEEFFVGFGKWNITIWYSSL